jgi:hypothetical protein
VPSVAPERRGRIDREAEPSGVAHLAASRGWLKGRVLANGSSAASTTERAGMPAAMGDEGDR